MTSQFTNVQGGIRTVKSFQSVILHFYFCPNRHNIWVYCDILELLKNKNAIYWEQQFLQNIWVLILTVSFLFFFPKQLVTKLRFHFCPKRTFYVNAILHSASIFDGCLIFNGFSRQGTCASPLRLHWHFRGKFIFHFHYNKLSRYFAVNFNFSRTQLFVTPLASSFFRNLSGEELLQLVPKVLISSLEFLGTTDMCFLFGLAGFKKLKKKTIYKMLFQFTPLNHNAEKNSKLSYIKVFVWIIISLVAICKNTTVFHLPHSILIFCCALKKWFSEK